MKTQTHTGLLYGASAACALLISGTPFANAATALQNNVPLNGLGAGSAALQYSLDVPAGATNLNVAIAGGTGDADLYVRYGATPTTSSFDCRPYLSGNNESCPVSAPQSGTYYVMVKPYSAFTNLTLTASYTEPSGGGGGGGGSGGGGSQTGTELSETNLSGARSSKAYYTLVVPAGATGLTFETSGGTGDVDLYVRFGAQPTTSSYDCRPYRSGNNETCNISAAQEGTYHVMLHAYSAYSGVSLSGSYSGSSNGGGGTNQAPTANIHNAPYTAEVNESITMSSSGSVDSDGSITGYQWDFGDGTGSTAANPTHSYTTAGDYTITLTVTDDDGATDTTTATANISAAPGNGGSSFQVSSHYYDKGTFDYFYTNYDSAFSDNYTDTDVEIHSYIVVEFSANVKTSTINSNAITVKRLDMPDTTENNNNRINGSFQLIGPKTAVFKPNVEYYANSGGTFDWNNPNWNGLKPNYRYTVTLANSIKDTSGNALNANGANWTFQTIDNDYGLYWFKNGSQAMKYVPGRTMPSDYYNPAKPVLIYAHGWEKTSTNYQEGQLRDYRREPMTFKPGSMYPSQGFVDLVQVWKDPSKNHQGKSWNVGVMYWNQFADDDYANLSKPQIAEAKIWSTNGKGGMRYAIRNWTGSSWSTGNTNVSTHAPMVPVSVILADAFISSTQAQSNPEIRLTGQSLGNQVATAVSYILKKGYVEGQVTANQFPKRLALIDPYWRNGKLENSWSNNHPATVDLGESGDWPAEMTRKVLTDVIDFADNTPGLDFVVEFYDTSRTPDNTIFWQDFGDKNVAQRDMAAMSYLQASWINGNEGDTNYMSHRHVNGKYWYLWQYAFAPPQTGFSASSTDAVIKANMNYYKSNKIRYSITSGGNTPTPADDNYTQYSGSWQK